MTIRIYRLEQSDKQITSYAVVSLIGVAITKFTDLAQAIDQALPKRHGTPTSDMVKIYLGLMAQGKNDFEADPLTPLVNQANVDILINRNVPITALNTGHILLDTDVTPHMTTPRYRKKRLTYLQRLWLCTDCLLSGAKRVGYSI